MNKLCLPLALLLLLGGCKAYGQPPGDTSQAAGGSAEATYSLPYADPPAHAGPSAEASPEASAPDQSRSEDTPRVAPKPAAVTEEAALDGTASSPPEESPPPGQPLSEFGTALGAGEPLFTQPEEAPPEDGGLPPPAEEGGEGIDTVLFEEELLRLVNGERERAGKPALVMEETIRWAARMRAPEVLQSLSHTRPDGTAYYTAFDEAGFVYAGKWHGENVSSMQFPSGMYTSAEAAAYMFGQLRASSGHLGNMLSDNYVRIGIGVFVQSDGATVRIGSAQMFAGQ